LAWILIGLVLAHGVIGVLLTAQSVQVWRQTGAPYWRRNALFWVRRLSGFAILVLLCLHVAAFGYTADGVYRLKWFGTGKLISQLLLVASILIHVGTNCTPLRVALGSHSRRGKMGDFLLLVSLLLVFMAVGIIVYYVRWNL
jgi:hypothetical protein